MENSPITKNNLDEDINKVICDALGCSKRATREITIRVGEFGHITLSICDDCVYKFE